MTAQIGNRLLFQPPPLGCALALPGLPGSGGKVYDGSAYGNSVTLVGAAWQQLPSGISCLNFDGIDDYVDCGNKDAFNITEDFTIEAWIKVNNPASLAAQAIAWKKGDAAFSGASGWGAYVQSSRLYINYGKGSGYQEKSIAFTATAWTHVAVGKCGSSVFWIYNGVPGTPQSVTGNPEVSSAGLWLGRIGPTHLLTGMTALTRIHRRALPPLEAGQHFDEEKGLFGV